MRWTELMVPLVSLFMASHADAETQALDSRTEVSGRVQAIAAAIRPQSGTWRLERWTSLDFRPIGSWLRVDTSISEKPDSKRPQRVTVRFFVAPSESSALSELEGSVSKPQIGPSGKCEELTPYCYVWRSHLEHDPMIIKFAVNQVWVDVGAEDSESAVAFAKEIIEALGVDKEGVR